DREGLAWTFGTEARRHSWGCIYPGHAATRDSRGAECSELPGRRSVFCRPRSRPIQCACNGRRSDVICDPHLVSDATVLLRRLRCLQWQLQRLGLSAQGRDQGVGRQRWTGCREPLGLRREPQDSRDLWCECGVAGCLGLTDGNVPRYWIRLDLLLEQ